MNSQQIRAVGPEIDPIWLGAGRQEDDLVKPQILIESTYGDAHPGSRHLDGVVEAARDGALGAGPVRRPGVYIGYLRWCGHRA